jgi:Tol biopolymer transport system component/DNA-binding winged helix-turn-helix (wHTH) protein
MTGPKSLIFQFDDIQVREREFTVTRAGETLSVEPKAFRVLTFLLRNPQRLITKDELLAAVWDDCTVSENALARAIARLRQVLGDSSREPRYIATVHSIGYRFVCDMTATEDVGTLPNEILEEPLSDPSSTGSKAKQRPSIIKTITYIGMSGIVLGMLLVILLPLHRSRAHAPQQRLLTRLTFHDGLEIGTTLSPDGRFIAYSSDRSGKFEIWVQQASGSDPVQITRGSGHNWQPDWSPDGKYIAYRDESGDGGLYAVPALGGTGQRIKLSGFGYYPHWSPDSRRILFETAAVAGDNRLFIAPIDGGEPREVLRDFVVKHGGGVISANWHSDGKRISVWLWHPSMGPSIWSIPVDGGVAMQTEVPLQSAGEFGSLALDDFADDHWFSWSPKGDALYFEQTLAGAKNLWKLGVNPATLEGTDLERLTTGPGPDVGPVVSPDGQKVFYTAASRKVRAWVYPLDADAGRILGDGAPVVSAGMDSWQPSLTRDGSQLIVDAQRGGSEQLWRKMLPSGEEAPILADSFLRSYPVWSPDGSRLAYFRHERSRKEGRLMMWSSKNGEETALTDISENQLGLTDWSTDGRTLLICKTSEMTGRAEVWSFLADAAPHAQGSAVKLISDPAHDIFQAHFSPDGRWIVFEAIKYQATGDESAIYVISAKGGPWIRLTDGKQWDDKPRWSPSGKIVYFLSGRGGFLNVWLTHFDPIRGNASKTDIRLTNFNSPNLMVPTNISAVEISVTKNKLALTLAQLSGNVWAINNVDR